MKNLVIADTGFWYALINKHDNFHKDALAALRNVDATLISTCPVVTETSYLLQSRLGQSAAIKFLRMHGESFYDVYDLSAEQMQRAGVLMTKYANLPMDLADASLVILAEELGHGLILSTDKRDFGAYRWKNHNPFKNLMFPND
jgi:predicted nucleic acid-binding protein